MWRCCFLFHFLCRHDAMPCLRQAAPWVPEKGQQADGGHEVRRWVAQYRHCTITRTNRAHHLPSANSKLLASIGLPWPPYPNEELQQMFSHDWWFLRIQYWEGQALLNSAVAPLFIGDQWSAQTLANCESDCDIIICESWSLIIVNVLLHASYCLQFAAVAWWWWVCVPREDENQAVQPELRCAEEWAHARRCEGLGQEEGWQNTRKRRNQKLKVNWKLQDQDIEVWRQWQLYFDFVYYLDSRL